MQLHPLENFSGNIWASLGKILGKFNKFGQNLDKVGRNLGKTD